MRSPLYPALLAVVIYPSIAAAQMPFSSLSSHAGLLGKTYIQGNYNYMTVDDPVLERFTDSSDGYRISINAPVRLATSAFGLDLYGRYEEIGLSGADAAGNSVSSDGEEFAVGIRGILLPESRFRPYVGVGGSQSDVTATAVLASGATNSLSEDELGLDLNVGFEFDVLEQVSTRINFDLASDGSLGEGLVIWWPHHTFFINGGILVPMDSDDGMSVGGVVGGGLAF